jgi:hypothetical protein
MYKANQSVFTIEISTRILYNYEGEIMDSNHLKRIFYNLGAGICGIASINAIYAGRSAKLLWNKK